MSYESNFFTYSLIAFWKIKETYSGNILICTNIKLTNTTIAKTKKKNVNDNDEITRMSEKSKNAKKIKRREKKETRKTGAKY